jgi:hypothetical protein
MNRRLVVTVEIREPPTGATPVPGPGLHAHGAP